VADTVTDLIAEHQSVERALVQIPMPRMSTEELAEIVNKALPRLNMTIDDVALNQICFFRGGSPITHISSDCTRRSRPSMMASRGSSLTT
jgi:hypothetical protein